MWNLLVAACCLAWLVCLVGSFRDRAGIPLLCIDVSPWYFVHVVPVSSVLTVGWHSDPAPQLVCVRLLWPLAVLSFAVGLGLPAVTSPFVLVLCFLLS